jgi:hypothetical protein
MLVAASRFGATPSTFCLGGRHRSNGHSPSFRLVCFRLLQDVVDIGTQRQLLRSSNSHVSNLQENKSEKLNLSLYCVVCLYDLRDKELAGSFRRRLIFSQAFTAFQNMLHAFYLKISYSLYVIRPVTHHLFSTSHSPSHMKTCVKILKFTFFSFNFKILTQVCM